MSITKDQQSALNAGLSRDVVRHRPARGRGPELSYLEGWYVIDRLNEILGPASWSYDTDVTMIVDEQREHEGRKRWHVTYRAKCILRVGDAVIGDHGAGHGIDADRGVAHESAVKEACTDALKRAAKSLGRSMGLALYDKDQSHVSDTPSATPATIESVLDAIAMSRTKADLARARELYRLLGSTASEEERLTVRAAAEEAQIRISKTA